LNLTIGSVPSRRSYQPTATLSQAFQTFENNNKSNNKLLKTTYYDSCIKADIPNPSTEPSFSMGSLSSSSSTSSSSSSSSTSSSLSSSSSTSSTAIVATKSVTNDQETGQSQPSITANCLNDQTCLLNNANSCDLNSLIEKENLLLRQGLNDIELVKQWYKNRLQENEMKQAKKDIKNRLKHQNLFSIDKALVNLKQLNDLNSIFHEFVAQNRQYSGLVMESQQQQPQKENLPTTDHQKKPSSIKYNDYIEKFSLNSEDVELDKFLIEKQDKIEDLKREKSLLIRKLFEMKSEAANLNRNLITSSRTTQNNDNNNEPNTKRPSVICNFIELNNSSMKN
jgi:hypothetical protein